MTKRNFRKRIFAYTVAGVMVMTPLSCTPAMAAEEVVSSIAETDVPDDEAPEIIEDVQNAEEAEPEPQVITGFADFDVREHYLSYPSNSRPDIAELVQDMPQTLDVYVEGDDVPVALEVTWEDLCDNYEDADVYYYQFSPEWDTDEYVLADDIDLWTEAPYVGVFFFESDENVKLTTSAVTGNINEITIFNYLINVMKVNRGVACGVLANIQCESGFNPKASIKDINGLISYGICQWNGEYEGGRFYALKEYAGDKYTTLDGQLRYLNYELQNSEKSAWNRIKGCANSADGAYEAGYNWARYFERCASRYHVERANLARDKYWPEYCQATAKPYTGSPEDSSNQNSSSSNASQSSSGWIQDSIGWKWKNTDGSYAESKWIMSGSEWYYLKSNGYMAESEWVKYGSYWYWMDASGKITRNKMIQTGGYSYYLKSNGFMASNEWVKYGSDWYWATKSGSMAKSQWIYTGGQWYYMKSNTKMAANEWVAYGSHWYWMDSSGAITYNRWVYTGNVWYYMKSNGFMASSEWVWSGSAWYWMNANGKMATNQWIYSGGAWYYLKSDGKMATNEWIKDNNKWYWMSSNGKLS